MLNWLYRRILKKLALKKDELINLQNRITPEQICAIKFVDGNKACPNTTALKVKLQQPLNDKALIKQKFQDHKIGNLELWAFMFLYDIPAMFSNKQKVKKLAVLRKAIDILLIPKS
jgi:hypothetical protein